MSAYNIPEATGATIRRSHLLKDNYFPITDFGASEDASPVTNTTAINAAIQAASTKGGTVVFPAGTF